MLREPADLEACRPAEIVVARHATANVARAARDAAGLVCETGGVLSHMAILARELGVPCVTGLRGIVDAVESGAELRVDGTHGVVDAPAPPYSAPAPARNAPPLRPGLVALLRFGRFSSTFECQQAILSPEALVRVATLVDAPAAVGLGGPLDIEFDDGCILTAETRLRDLATGLARRLEAGALSASALRATYANDSRWSGWDGIPSDIASALFRFVRMNRITWIAALAKEDVALALRAALLERRDADEPVARDADEPVEERFLRVLAATGSSSANAGLPPHLRRRVDTLADLVWVTERKNSVLSRCAAIVGQLPIAEALGLEPDSLADDGTNAGRHRRVQDVRAGARGRWVMALSSRRRTRMVVIENFGSCNMRCSYCFPEHMWSRQGHSAAMSEDTLRGTLEVAFNTPETEPVDVRFAGGEPLLAGRDWLETAFTITREVADRHGKRFTLSLQTNATLVTPELARLLAEHDVRVGVSLDGDASINEATRGDTDRTLSGFHRLTEAYGHVPGVIVTVTRANATRMHEVVAHLDSLGVALFRANQMGATASWNVALAPRAEEWAAARQALIEEMAARDGTIMELNLSQAVVKLVSSLFGGQSPFASPRGCCAMRCPAGTELLYFDRKGGAYPCPRTNVTATAKVAGYADADFDERWDEMLGELDTAMEVPSTCAACPANVVCDYGCHAFNVAEGNFFEVNCDASKAFFGWLMAHPEQVARVFLLSQRRAEQRARADWNSPRRAAPLPNATVSALAGDIGTRFLDHLARPDLDPDVLPQRFGWHEDRVPLLQITRRRLGAPRSPSPPEGK